MKNKSLVALLLVALMLLAGTAAFAADPTPITAADIDEVETINEITYYRITDAAGNTYYPCTVLDKVGATCNADAYTIYGVYSNDLSVIAKQIKIVFAGSSDAHKEACKDSYTSEKNKPATCTEAGLKGYLYCPDCKEVVNAGEIIPALGHEYDPIGVIVEVPGWFSKGKILHFCMHEGCEAYDLTKIEDVLPKVPYEYYKAFITNMVAIITNLMWSDAVLL